MGFTGFRVYKPFGKLFKELGAAASASQFAPDVKQFLKSTLKTAIQLTPARSLSLIKKNQRRQYSNRINYIPSFHDLLDPTLIVRTDGAKWLFFHNKWYRPDEWHLPDDAYAAYQELMVERDRRMETERDEFIAFRAQARFLYKKSWWEIGQSVGIDVPCSQQVKDAVSRRTRSQLKRGNRQNPPKGYAQQRGGKGIYSIVVYNPFLEETSQYKQFSGRQILAEAMQKHQAVFDKKVADRQVQTILRILRALLA